MDAHALRAMAQRCRELDRIAVNPEIKAQLREWVDDLEAEATEYERRREQAPQRRLTRSRLAPD